MAKTSVTTTRLHSKNSLFEQLPGESDIKFIKRITSTALPATSNNETATASTNEDKDRPKPKYQRVEEWDAEREAKGELSWEERVQHEGQRYGNQVRQNDILSRNLKGF